MTCHSDGRRRRAGIIAAVWIDTHCHLDAAEFDADRDDVVARARAAGVARSSSRRSTSATSNGCASSRTGTGSPMRSASIRCAPAAPATATSTALREALARHAGDPRLVAVGEIGLDHFVARPRPRRQARHLRRAARARRRVRPAGAAARAPRRRHGAQAPAPPAGRGRHRPRLQRQRAAGRRPSSSSAFGSASAARSPSSGRCASAASAGAVPLDAIVMETDSPDIPPQWLYRTAEARAAGATMRNEPAELARIGAELAAPARRSPVEALAAATTRQRASPRCRAWPALSPRLTHELRRRPASCPR